jgi:aspartate-semialdehyde dehydrogenase
MTGQLARQEHHPGLGRLADRRLLRELAYIGGSWTAGPGGAVFEVKDPATGMPVARVARLGAAEAGRAVASATTAFPAWRKLLPQERAARLRAWFERITQAREDLALLMVLEQGKPLAEALGEIDYAASFVEWYAEEARRVTVEGVQSHLPGTEMTVRREPVGVVGVATPWNFPSAMLTRKVAAALAELAERAGIPAGVLNIVTGDADAVVGALCDDMRVRALSFTGSTLVGRLIAARCAPTMKRLVMELGGHAPLMVFADADLDRAVDIALGAKFATSGQDCLAANRILVERPVYDAFCRAFAARVEALRVGPGLEAGTEIGPLMHDGAVRKCEDHVRDALDRGARCLAGGARHPAGPLFYRPTVLADVPADALVMREETFGPVAAILPFDREEEAVSRANDTEYGLIAYVVTRDAARIARLARALDFGMVAVNRVKVTGAPVPFGGVKQSGLGREGSRHGLEAFTDLRYICLDAS